MMDGEGFQSCKFCQRQALRVEELLERIAQLERIRYGTDWEPPAEFRLTAMQRRIVQVLMGSERFRTKEFLLEATRSVGGTKKDVAVPETVDVQICKIRKAFAPYGLVIENQFAGGFRLSPESRERLNNWTPPKQRSAEAA